MSERPTLRIVVPGRPMPKERPRVYRLPDGRSRAITPKRTEQWEQLVAIHAQMAAARARWIVPDRVACGILLMRHQAVIELCESELERWGQSDVDNLEKAILDGLQAGHALRNDRDVVDLRARFG